MTAPDAATSVPAGKDPLLRGWPLGWRLALAMLAIAAMAVNRVDIGTAWLFFLCAAVAAYRVPRVIRLLRRRDWLSASPWLLLAAGTAMAMAHQAWAVRAADARFRELISAVERDPCRAKAIAPPVVRAGTGDGTTRHTLKAGLLEYPLIVREDGKQATLTLVLHIDIDDVRSYTFDTKVCSKRG